MTLLFPPTLPGAGYPKNFWSGTGCVLSTLLLGKGRERVKLSPVMVTTIIYLSVVYLMVVYIKLDATMGR